MAKAQMGFLGNLFLVMVALGLLGGVMYIYFGSPAGSPAGSSTNVSSTFDSDSGASGPQTWELTNDVGEVATVVVTPFVNSGTFSETTDSAGWFVTIPGVQPIPLPISGSIVHDSQDRWSFTLTKMQGSISILLQAEGTSNGNFPNANSVTGTISGTIKTPMDSGLHVAGRWTGRRV